MSAGIDTIRVILPVPKIIRISNVVIAGGGGNLSIIDLGLVSLRDAAIQGRNNVLVPYLDGRLISKIRFVLKATLPLDSFSSFFITPNTGWLGNSTLGFGHIFDGESCDTEGEQNDSHGTDLFGKAASLTQIADCGPLVWILQNPVNSNDILNLGVWQADAPHCVYDSILDPNDHIQVITSVEQSGVSGSELPDFDDEGGTTPDGTITWSDQGPILDGEVHVIVEVIEGISLMPPYAATIEFIAPPVETVAGETMPDVTVMIKDQNGDPYTMTGNGNNSAQVTILLNCFGDFNGNYAFETSANADAVTGIATFSGIVPVGTGTFVLRARTFPTFTCDQILSDPFDVTAP